MVGDGRAEGSSGIEDRGQAAIPLKPDFDGMHVHIFEKLTTWRCIYRGLTVTEIFSDCIYLFVSGLFGEYLSFLIDFQSFLFLSDIFTPFSNW